MTSSLPRFTIPETWTELAAKAVQYPLNWLQSRYSQWIKFLVLQRVEELAKLEAAMHKDSFSSATQILYSLPRETESPAEKAAKQAWERMLVQQRMQAQGRELRQQVNDVYQVQQALQQRIRANGVGRASASNFSGF